MRYNGTVWCGLCDEVMYYDRKNDWYICKGCLSFYRKVPKGVICLCFNKQDMSKIYKYFKCLKCERKVFLSQDFSGKFRYLLKSSKDKRWNQYIKEQDACRSYCIKNDLRVLDSEFR